MGSDLRSQLEGLRENLPPGNGDVLSSSQPNGEALPNGETILSDVEISTRSPFYIYFAANYDIDPLIRKLYPNGKQQYLNEMLRSMEAGQNQWPESISNREEALAPIPENDIRQWFKDAGRQAMEQAGYSDPDVYLREILQQEGLPADRAAKPEISNSSAEPAVKKPIDIISDPDQGESQLNYFESPSIQRDDALRGRLVKKRVPESVRTKKDGRPLRENQADFAGSKGMRRQDEKPHADGLIVNVGTGPRAESSKQNPAQGIKFNQKLGVRVHPNYSPKNYQHAQEAALEAAPGAEAWLRTKEEGTDSGFNISGEAPERVAGMNFDWSGLEAGGDSIFVSFVGKVENKNTGRLEDRNVNLVFNLPKETALAAKTGERQAIEQAARECVYKNQGVHFVQIAYDRSSGNVFFGLGKKNLPEIGVQLSADGLRKIAGNKADEVVEYIDRKSREFSTLDYEKEKEPMWAFDKFLLEQYVPGQNKKLKQLVWDEAFRQTWEKAVGQEKLGQLRAQAEQMPPVQAAPPDNYRANPVQRQVSPDKARSVIRNPERNRWLVSTDVGQKADILGPKNKFYNLIHKEFGTDYRRFFEAGKFRGFANEAEISAPEAINLLAEKVLLESGRNEDYQEFQRFAELPHNKQVDFLAASGLKIGDERTFGILFKRLYLFITGGEAKQRDSADIGKGVSRTPERVSRSERVRSRHTPVVEHQPARQGRSEALRKILARVERQVVNQPYNRDEDPLVEAGIF